MKLIRHRQFTGFFALILFVLVFSIPAEAGLSDIEAEAVWGRVAKATELNGLPFNVKNDETPNAWVANGKSVTVTSGLLKLLKTQSELYGVLAHEAGHVKLDHHESTVKRGVGLSLAARLLSDFFGGGIASTAVGVGANLAYAGWSREQEVEADDYSIRIAHRMGEDPVGLYSALLRLSKNGSRTQPSGFNSHPPDERRLAHIRNEILINNPNAVFPAGDQITVSPLPVSDPQPNLAEKPTKPSIQKSGGYDIDAAIERMKKEEAAKKTHSGSQN